MSDKRVENSRRKFIKHILAGAAALPLAGVALRGAAQETTTTRKVDPNSALGKGLHYTENAKALPESAARKPNEFCHTCQHFQAKAAQGESPQWAPCSIFSGRLVARDGWCASWTAAS